MADHQVRSLAPLSVRSLVVCRSNPARLKACVSCRTRGRSRSSWASTRGACAHEPVLQAAEPGVPSLNSHAHLRECSHHAHRRFRKAVKRVPGKYGQRYYKNVGLGYRTPKSAVEGAVTTSLSQACSKLKHLRLFCSMRRGEAASNAVCTGTHSSARSVSCARARSAHARSPGSSSVLRALGMTVQVVYAGAAVQAPTLTRSVLSPETSPFAAASSRAP